MNYMQKLKAIYPIITGENTKILRTVCEEVVEVTPEIKEFWENLLDLMREYDWVGLAAPQVNQNLRMCAITSRKVSKKNKENTGEEILINPIIIDKSDKMFEDLEACLSLPWIEGKVMRYEWVVVKYLNLSGKEKVKKFKWFNATIVQHEMDHLDGVLFTDKLVK